MTKNSTSFAVLGAGSWGTALAILLSDNKHPTTLWGRDRHQIEAMMRDRVNSRYLGGIKLPESLSMTSQLDEAVKEADIILNVTPSHNFRKLLERLNRYFKSGKKLVWACKGLEHETGKLLHEVAQETLGETAPIAVISGPNFAKEVASGIPSATTVASNNLELADIVAACLHNHWFRAYSSQDMIGVEIAGALKNGLAIAAGIADGLGFGNNTRAALLTRGMNEISRLGIKLGGERETFMGLAGIGDIILTCTGDQSRNRKLGLLLAQGRSIQAAVEEIGQVIEGITTVKVATKISSKMAVELPILEQVHAVLFDAKSPRDAVNDLFMRERKTEHDKSIDVSH